MRGCYNDFMEECKNDEGNSATKRDGRLSKYLTAKESIRYTGHKVATPLGKFDSSGVAFSSTGCDV